MQYHPSTVNYLLQGSPLQVIYCFGGAFHSLLQEAGFRCWLGTFQQFGVPGFEIFRSDDYGRTWRPYSNVPNLDDDPDVWFHPFLYELPRPFAGLPKGALLFSGNRVGDFTSTRIEVYASLDKGLTWDYLSTVAVGGPPVAENGNTPVWEPFLLLHRGRLICYYSDQRDPDHGQKLAHQTSTDLRAWGPVVDDVAFVKLVYREWRSSHRARSWGRIPAPTSR